MARRAAYAKLYKESYRKSPAVWVDAGNWSEGSGTPDADIKTRMLLSAMGEIGYVAANLSERDLQAGLDAFQKMRKGVKFPFVSSNLVLQSNGKTIVDPFTIVTLEPRKYPDLKTPLRVAIVGATRFNPTFLKSAGNDSVIIANPVDELKKYVPQMRQKADKVILLAAMPSDDAHLVARQVPGIDLIVGAFGGMVTAVPDKEGTTPIFYVGNQGKYLAELRVHQKEGLTEVKSYLQYLSAEYAEDPSMKAKVDAALAEMNSRSKTLAVKSASPSAGSVAASEPVANAVYLTSEACKDCHASEYAVWKGSGHAHAMETLANKKSDFNPQCVKCHVVGFQKKGGFVNRQETPVLVNVQCESCHGPGTRHIKNPAAPYGKAGPLACVNCHNRENSPAFEFNAYWAKIRHGA